MVREENLDNIDGRLDDIEDHLDDLEKKASEMMNRDSSRRSSYHDLGRKMTTGDLNSPRLHTSAGHDVIEVDDEDKESSESEILDTSHEDLAHAWSEDDEHFVLRRRSLLRRPVRAKSRSSFLSRRSISVVSVASSEEGEVSEYVDSKRSTLESNISSPAANNNNAEEQLNSLDLDLESDQDDPDPTFN